MSTATPDLLPDDVFGDEGDAPPPFELLQFQAQRIEERSNGRLRVELATQESEDRQVVRFVVIVPSHDYRCTLFEIQHRPHLMLPASFIPPEPLPNYLRNRYVAPGSMSQLLTIPRVDTYLARTVENPWVANTPAEFQQKLQQLFASQEVRAILASLVSLSGKPPVSQAS